MESLGATFPTRTVQESRSRGSTDMGNVVILIKHLKLFQDV